MAKIYAKSGSLRHVKDALKAACPGDTVVMPKGANATWNGYVTIPADVRLVEDVPAGDAVRQEERK